jgi:hypothetical protein
LSSAKRSHCTAASDRFANGRQIACKFVISHTLSPAAKLTSAINLPTIFSKPLHPPHRLPSPLPKTYEKVILDGTNATAIVGT